MQGRLARRNLPEAQTLLPRVGSGGGRIQQHRKKARVGRRPLFSVIIANGKFPTWCLVVRQQGSSTDPWWSGSQQQRLQILQLQWQLAARRV